MTEIPEYIEEKIWKDKYPKGIPKEVEIPDLNLTEFIERDLEAYLDKVAFVYEEEKTTYRQARNSARSLSRALTDIGIEKGDVVGIYMYNSPDWSVAYHGILRTGAIVTGINLLYTPREVTYQLNDSKAENIFIHKKYCSTFGEILESEGSSRRINGEGNLNIENTIVVGSEGEDVYLENRENVENVYYLENLIENYESESLDVDIDHEDTAVLQYTGGTTGRPKGCVLSHRNLIANAIQSVAWHAYMCEQAGVNRLTALCVLPWYHIYGQVIDLSAGVVMGEKGIIATGFDPEEWMRLIQRYECGLLLGVPTMYLMMANHSKFEEYDLSSLIWVSSGAAPLPQETVRKFKEVHNVNILNGFGLSEASSVTHSTPPLQENRQKYGVLSVGIGYPNTLYGIIDLNKDEPKFLPLENTGELVVSGPQVMKRYWNKPERTEEVFFEAGGRKWLKTGDVAIMDKDGYTYFIERKNEIIEYGEQLIYPREIEEIFFSHPAVEDVAVVGVPSVNNKKIKAFVVLNEKYEDEIGEEEMLEFGRENLEDPKYPDSIGFLDQIPKTNSGKYLKRKLVDMEVFGEDLGVTSF